MAHLFSEITIKNVHIRNRIVMPPMVCFGGAKEDGLVTDRHVRHYEDRAKGGVGLIIIEAACVNSDARLSGYQLGLWSDRHAEGFARIADACHSHGAKVMVQIHHGGLKTAPGVSADRIAPSDFQNGKFSAREMSREELHSVQKDFLNAARRAKMAGLDGIELHGCHGYLISQFLSPLVNHREDEYGGSLYNRTRFVTEILDSIRTELGSEDFLIGCRMGGNEPSLDEGIEIARILEQHGVDLLHVSSGFDYPEHPEAPADFQYNWIVYGATEIKKRVGIPVIAVNNIKTPKRANYLIENGLADFAAIGRRMMVDREWANKAREGLEIFECLDCLKCGLFESVNLCRRNTNMWL